MPAWLQWALILIGLAVIILLAVFIIRQYRVVQAGKKRAARNEAFAAERKENMVESIKVLAMAIEQDQVEYSEACLRIKGLLDHVAPDLLAQTPYRIFQEMHDHIQHMPTHRARQETDHRFVQKMDRERFALEEKHGDSIRRAATAIRHHRF
ncbi:MAG: DUF2489 domain-containing protein [Marinobacter sp.]|uniref:DUF2489 domain-containing protein n=1 Tax=Marinobacter sp. TaxID=50741 RepID=UPI00299DB3B8|nr:DUF2489 domain-containing protein [Marinobacter sp.]MDX1635404.1 DUF2489 domain-containing protein [Marinobacter sp.]